jgi:hypothetical protein
MFTAENGLPQRTPKIAKGKMKFYFYDDPIGSTQSVSSVLISGKKLVFPLRPSRPLR